MKTIPIAAAAAAALFALTPPTSAAAGVGYETTATVRFAPEELTSAAGLNRVASRIRRIVDGACRHGVPRGANFTQERKDCRAELTADILERIGHPALAARFAPEGRTSFADARP